MARRAVNIVGIVQGVGFRPFVHELATRHGLTGFVRNDRGAVLIEIEGDSDALDRFLSELTSGPPALARIEEIRWTPLPTIGDTRFRIESSQAASAGPIFISPDVATCIDCLRELFDRGDRRYRYPFLNCTNCGPRFTIVRGSPYDRAQTTMASFPMCAPCLAEYNDPQNRRFHAQPTACPTCGPRLESFDRHGARLLGEEALSSVVEALLLGKLVALKGVGGYHLVCRADSDAAVTELRARKHRDQKALAVMVKDVAAARVLCELDPSEQSLLTSPRCPIVLLRRRRAAPVAAAVAPRNPYLGVMLPYSPLHHLLLADLGGIALVMTSGNQSDEPIAYQDADALARLAPIADVVLAHDRPIHLRCDDSVVQWVGGAPVPIRRSRGYAPEPISLPLPCQRPILAVGGQMKCTFALGRGRHAFQSHHLGDLDHYEAYRAFVESVDHYERLFTIAPELIAHDLHPDYSSTRFARDRARAMPSVAIQHHHAHVASCMAENGLLEPVIGVAFDGTGLGTDGAVWGGEFFTGDYRGFVRAAHLRYVAMPGGDHAIREPWRMAAAHLVDAGREDELARLAVPAPALATIRRLIDRRVNAPLTSSAGRLFDAVAAILGFHGQTAYEGQAAMELEWLAAAIEPAGEYSFEILEPDDRDSSLLIDARPIFDDLCADVRAGRDRALVARRFHSTIARMICQCCVTIRDRTGLGAVALSGGVFMNALLTNDSQTLLARQGFRVHRHRLVPPGDGGLSLGQLAIAASRDTANLE